MCGPETKGAWLATVFGTGIALFGLLDGTVAALGCVCLFFTSVFCPWAAAVPFTCGLFVFLAVRGPVENGCFGSLENHCQNRWALIDPPTLLFPWGRFALTATCSSISQLSGVYVLP